MGQTIGNNVFCGRKSHILWWAAKVHRERLLHSTKPPLSFTMRVVQLVVLVLLPLALAHPHHHKHRHRNHRHHHNHDSDDYDDYDSTTTGIDYAKCSTDFFSVCSTQYSNALSSGTSVETLFKCLDDNSNQLSDGCLQAIEGHPASECAGDAQNLCPSMQSSADQLRHCLLQYGETGLTKTCYEALDTYGGQAFKAIDNPSLLTGQSPPTPHHDHHGYDGDGDWDDHHHHMFPFWIPAGVAILALITCCMYRRRRRRTLRAIRRQQQATPQYVQVAVVPTAPPMPGTSPMYAVVSPSPVNTDQPGSAQPEASVSVPPGSVEMNDYSDHMPPMSNRGTGYVRLTTTEN